MSVAVLLAALAGMCAAGAVVDLAGLARAGRPGARAAATPSGRLRRPGRALARVLAAVGRRAGTPTAPSDLAARIDAAGAPGGLRVEDVMALKAGGALAALLAVVTLASAAPGRLGLLVVLVGPAAAFLAPDLWLRRRARARAVTLDAELADVLDLLRVAVDAGLPPWRALGEVGRRRGGLLAAELARTAARVALGAPRSEAYATLGRRCPTPGVAALLAVLARADRHGAPPAPALRALADDARASAAQRLRDDAARAAPQIQLAVALLLVPAVMLLVAAALLAGLR